VLLRVALLLAIAYGLSLPLRDVLAYPNRVSVLPNLQTDAEAYYTLGRAIAEQRSLSAFPIRHPPGWIGLLAIAFNIAGVSYVTGKLISWFALIATVAGGAWLARRMYGRTAGWIAAVLIATSPALRGYVGTVQYEVFTGALLLAVMVLAVRTIESVSNRERWRRAVWVGLVGGTLILTRETFAVIVPLVGIWIGRRIHAHVPRRTAVLTAVTVGCIAIAPAAGWSTMQSLRYGALITISEKGPIVIELGHNTRANGTYNAPLVGIGPPTGLAFAMQNPGREVVLSVRKVLYFWGVLRDGWNVPRPAALWLWRATTGLVPFEFFGALARGGWLLGLFLIAIWRLGPEGRAQWWGVPGVVVLLMVVHIITLSSHRFAVPGLPLVFTIVSGPLAVLVSHLRLAFRSRAVVGACALLAAIAVAMQFQSWPLQMRMHAADLDGLLADNVVDSVARRTVRSADAARGVRPVALLTDHFFGRGTIRVTLGARRIAEPPAEGAPAVRVALLNLNGNTVCATDWVAGELVADLFRPIDLTCHLAKDQVATLAVFSLGAVDFALDDVSLVWIQ
jgi:4-amino-4-deoxy-L-arabinose transferase-like glycosyltransferase